MAQSRVTTLQVRNRREWRSWLARHHASGLLAAAGVAAAPTDNHYSPRTAFPELPDYIATGLQREPKAWAFFRNLAPSCRRQYVGWIHSAKREKRLKEAIRLLAAGKKLGLK